MHRNIAQILFYNDFSEKAEDMKHFPAKFDCFLNAFLKFVKNWKIFSTDNKFYATNK